MASAEATLLLRPPENAIPENDSINIFPQTTINSENSKSSSGYVGSMVLAVLLISASATQEISVYVSDHQKYWVQIVNSIYILLAFAILMVCWSKQVMKQKAEGFREIETVVALGIFWGFGAIYDYSTIFYKSHCFQDWLKTGDIQLIDIIVETFYRVIRPIYKFFLVLVYTLCRNSVFPDTRMVRYGLMFILATNLSIWVELLFDEAVLDHKTFHHGFDNISSNVTDYCFGNKSEIDQVMSTNTRICIPSMVEFTLLIVEGVMHWFAHCESTKKVTENRASNNVQSNTGDANNGKSEWFNFQFWLKDTDCWSKVLFSLTFPFSIALNVVFAILSRDAAIQESFPSELCNPFIYYSTAFWLFNILVSICTYVVSRRFTSSNLSFKNLIGIERLLLLSLFGPMLMGFFSIIAIFHEWKSPDFPSVQTPWKFFFQEMTNTAQILIQVPLIFYVRRISNNVFQSFVSREATLTLEVESGLPHSKAGGREIVTGNTRQSSRLPRNEDRGFRCARSYGAIGMGHSINEDTESREIISEVKADVHTPGDTKLEAMADVQTPDDSTLSDTDKVSLQDVSCDQDASCNGGRLSKSVEASVDSKDVNAWEQSQIVEDNNLLSRNTRLNPAVVDHDHLQESNHLDDNFAEGNPADSDNRVKEGENNADSCDAVKVNVTKRLHFVTNWPKYVLLAAIFHMLISNAMHWIVNNFVDPRYESLTLVKAYYNTTYWPIVASVLAPLEIFFRFHSMMLFIWAWRRLSFISIIKVQSTDGTHQREEI